VHPEYRSIIDTYVRRFDIEVETVDFNDEGRIDTRRLQALLGPDVSGVAIQSPNFFGTIEDTAQVSRMAHEAGALSLVAVAEVMSLGLLRPPGAGETEARADVVCGEAQSLGIPMSFGGPHLGFIAARQEYVRQLPGRLVGMGQDEAGRRAFVVTLATREQHIRRERATSNICTNQSLCAVMATIYLAAVGPHLLREIAGVNTLNLKYLMDRIARDTPHSVRFAGPRFNEVVVSIDGDFHGRVDRLRRDGIVAGLSLERYFPDLADSLLITVTEVHGKADIDALVEGLA
jgi:glycine dehydrogenase subunit 1